MMRKQPVPVYRATPRIEQMRKAVVDSRPILCSERAMLVTDSYRRTESLPYELRRAYALKNILDHMTQNIFEGELLVGSHGSNGRRSAPVFPEFSISWLEEELDSRLESREQDRFEVPPGVKRDIMSIAPYWKDRTVYDHYRALLPEEAKRARDAYMFSRDLFERNGYGHTCYDVPKILQVGLLGIRKETEQLLQGVSLETPEGIEKKTYYEATLICLDAMCDYALRYAETAKKYAQNERDPQRKAELDKIADVCAHALREPARDLWEALQTIVWMQLIIQTETNGDSVSPGRLDQHLYPYYTKDRDSGRYTDEQVQELLDCLWLKFNEIIKVQDSESIHIHPGFPMTPNLTIGGVTPDGRDATNELSYLMLNAQSHIRLTNPQFTVRLHAETPEPFKKRVAQVISLGTGMPALFGDPGCMKAIRRVFPDMPEQQVRDYGIVGCVELAPNGFQGKVNGGFLNVARIVDLALNGGVDRLTGEQLGPSTDVDFASYDDLMKAVAIQAEYFVRMQVINACVVDMVQRRYTPHLALSAVVPGCLQNGRDMTWGSSTYGATPIFLVGLATAANSLAAVKTAVFDDADFSLQALKSAQDANFAGEEGRKVRSVLLRAPKYGNDDDRADAVMRQMSDLIFQTIERFADADGRPYVPAVLTLGGTVPHGWKTGATADGRLAKAPVSDSMSPANGTDTEGPTAVLLSAAKIDQSHLLEGNVLNLKFSPTALSSDEDLEKLMCMVDTYLLDLQGQEVQINVVDGSVLRKAQKTPENYRDLIIRVAGYSARFVELARELQDDIIARTEHERV